MSDELAERLLGLKAGPALCVRDERARALVGAHFEFIWRVLRRLGVAASEVDDATQQVFWVAVRKICPDQSKTDQAYLLGIALRVASEYRRSHRRRRESLGLEAVDLSDPGPSPEEQLDRRRALGLADSILESMPWELRVVYVLHEVEQRTTVEIAELLDVPQGTVASRLRRAREVFSDAVGRLRAGRVPEGGEA